MVTRSGLDGPGIESRWVRFSEFVQTGAGAHTVSYTTGKVADRGVDHPPLSSVDVKERVELYLYTPLCLHGMLPPAF
jgi:hypothetical protein